MSIAIDTDTSILEALDWEPAFPCESNIHPHDHDAEWSLMLTCGHGALICTEVKNRGLALIESEKGYCPDCGETGGDIALLVPITGEQR